MASEKPGNILIERMKLALRCGNYDDLSARLGVTRSLLARCRRAGRLPDALRAKLSVCGINPDWVERESGGVYLTGEEGPEQSALLREEPLRYVMQRALREFEDSTPASDDVILQ